MKLATKVAIVTGAAQGIGRGIAIKFASEGATVVVVDINLVQAQQVVNEIVSQGSKAKAIKLNILDRVGIQEMVKSTLEEFKAIHILVNNAGLIPKRALVTELTEEQWDLVVDVNLKGTFNCIQAVLPTMIEKRYGKIVNISSIGGMGFPRAGFAHYSAAKAGVVMLTKSIATEVGRYDINVNGIAPGTIIHERQYVQLGKEAVEKHIREASKSNILGRCGGAEDIGNLALFLASDDSKNITGQVILSTSGEIGGL